MATAAAGELAPRCTSRPAAGLLQYGCSQICGICRGLENSGTMGGIGRPQSAPPGKQPPPGPGRSVSFDNIDARRASVIGRQRPGSAASSRPSSASASSALSRGSQSSLYLGGGGGRPRPRKTPTNTRISQRTFLPGSRVDWSRSWIAPASVVVVQPRRVQGQARPKARPRTKKIIVPPVAPPRVRVVRYAIPGLAAVSKRRAPSPSSLFARRAMQVKSEVKKQLGEHVLVVLHGRFMGSAIDRPALQYAPLLSQLLSLAPAGTKVSAALLECHDYWPTMARSEPKSLELGPLGEALLEALASTLKKCKTATLVAHSLGAWLLYKLLAAMLNRVQQKKPGYKLLNEKIVRVVLISPVTNHEWLGKAREPIVLSNVPCLLISGDHDKLIPTWYVEAAVRPWFPNLKPLRVMEGGNHLGCLLPSAADIWDRPLPLAGPNGSVMLPGGHGWTSRGEFQVRGSIIGHARNNM